MNANKAAYWIAVGVLAMGLNTEYRHGNFAGLHRIADRAGVAVCQITARAEKTVAVAKLLMRPDEGLQDTLVASADEPEIARAHGKFLRQRSRSREEAALFRDGVRDRLREEIRAHADEIRARAEMQRAEIEMQLRTHSPFAFANVRDGNLAVFCPKARERIALNRMAAGSPSIDSQKIEVRETF